MPIIYAATLSLRSHYTRPGPSASGQVRIRPYAVDDASGVCENLSWAVYSIPPTTHWTRNVSNHARLHCGSVSIAFAVGRQYAGTSSRPVTSASSTVPHPCWPIRL
jgi:hypothetical protein